MARFVREMTKTMMRRRPVRASREAVGAKIAHLRREGRPRAQAVAMALNMGREGRLGPRGGYRRKGGS